MGSRGMAPSFLQYWSKAADLFLNNVDKMGEIMKKTCLDIRFALLATVAISCFATPALSQTDPKAEDEGGLEEIVVSANKREENLQQTPIAMRSKSAAARRLAQAS